mmetsp:Transcript_24628/g.75024  ORF Transcript_24628/g.75024 Transcript_24628/m.75024 type:complete len:228 (-) Transcript_24628:840-1523(-)
MTLASSFAPHRAARHQAGQQSKNANCFFWAAGARVRRISTGNIYYWAGCRLPIDAIDLKYVAPLAHRRGAGRRQRRPAVEHVDATQRLRSRDNNHAARVDGRRQGPALRPDGLPRAAGARAVPRERRRRVRGRGPGRGAAALPGAAVDGGLPRRDGATIRASGALHAHGQHRPRPLQRVAGCFFVIAVAALRRAVRERHVVHGPAELGRRRRPAGHVLVVDGRGRLI